MTNEQIAKIVAAATSESIHKPLGTHLRNSTMVENYVITWSPDENNGSPIIYDELDSQAWNDGEVFTVRPLRRGWYEFCSAQKRRSALGCWENGEPCDIVERIARVKGDRIIA